MAHTQMPVMANAGGVNPLPVKCKDAPHKPGSAKYDECEIEEICAKCASVNQQAKARSLRRRDASYDVAREKGNKMCDSLKGFAARKSPNHQPLGGFSHLSPKCATQMQDKADSGTPPYKGFSPDHVQEIQLGGAPTELSNLRWMSSAPNSWMGTTLSGFETTGPNKHTGVKPDCC